MRFPDFPKELMKIRPMEEILPKLGFIESEGGYVRHFEGIRFFLCSGMFYGVWSLIRQGLVTKNEAWPPDERIIKSPISSAELLSEIYKSWRDIFGSKAPSDSLLNCGKEWAEYQRVLIMNRPRPPVLCVDSQMLRFCLNKIKKAHEVENEDYAMSFSTENNQLILNTNKVEYHCPISFGEWIGEMIVSASVLFLLLPSKFINGARLEQQGKALVVNNQRIPAKWSERKGMALKVDPSLTREIPIPYNFPKGTKFMSDHEGNLFCCYMNSAFKLDENGMLALTPKNTLEDMGQPVPVEYFRDAAIRANRE